MRLIILLFVVPVSLSFSFVPHFLISQNEEVAPLIMIQIVISLPSLCPCLPNPHHNSTKDATAIHSVNSIHSQVSLLHIIPLPIMTRVTGSLNKNESGESVWLLGAKF